MTNPTVKFNWGEKDDIDLSSVQNGSLYFSLDSQEIMLDIDDERHVVSTREPAATDSSYGTIKLNESLGISTDANGKLTVDGRFGHMADTNGIYVPMHLTPELVGKGSLLLTEANNMVVGNKSIACVTGNNVNLSQTAAAGATTFYVANNYGNRITLSAADGGVACATEADSLNTVEITSIRINGSEVVPTSSSAGDSYPIIITTAEPISTTGALTKIRVYGSADGFSSLFIGQNVGTGDRVEDRGASLVLGQNVMNHSNASACVGGQLYNIGNGSALFGRLHINKKNRAFMVGTGHDSSNGPSENVFAAGSYSNIKSDTLFAIGNGTSETARSNVFEITSDRGIVLESPNGTFFKIKMTDQGTLDITQMT